MNIFDKIFKRNKKVQIAETDYVFHFLDNVKPLDDFMLEAKFKSGEIKLYDVKPLIERYHMFRVFHNNKEMFEKFTVDDFSLVWNDQVDLHCNELWNNGVEKNNKEFIYV
ncbi:MAG: DUF2442 domain-containing protein [Eubacterium sp.]|jgi:hypothetical protein|nr:DUF2442 domain-containing protein [Eubacterium sp.]